MIAMTADMLRVLILAVHWHGNTPMLQCYLHAATCWPLHGTERLLQLTWLAQVCPIVAQSVRQAAGLCCIKGGWLTYDAAHALIICGCYLLVGVVLKRNILQQVSGRQVRLQLL
jgi:hypothetical protein